MTSVSNANEPGAILFSTLRWRLDQTVRCVVVLVLWIGKVQREGELLGAAEGDLVLL